MRTVSSFRSLLPGTLILSLLAACGGGDGVSPIADEPAPIGGGGGGGGAQACDPGDAATFDACGVGYVTLTDAEGDVLSYAVDIVSLTLERANGDIIETLPETARIDFVDYVELAELVSAPRIPPGNYVGGAITLDFTDAEVVVEQGGEAVRASVVDAQGQPLGETTLEVALSEGAALNIAVGRPALLALDFDLEASNEIDVAPVPPVVTVLPVLLAEIAPVEEKTLRVRGALESVDVAGNAYRVDVRPLARAAGRFGDVTVQVTDETTWDIDGEVLTGTAGLEALAALPPDTLTVAFGVLSTAQASFTATSVLAGDSVPGIEADTVVGTVVARQGDELIVRGATVVRDEPDAAAAGFFERVDVTIGPNTVVQRPDDPAPDLTGTAISVGQRVRVFGEASLPEAEDNGEDVFAPIVLPPLEMDATAGRVQLLRSQVSGLVVENQPGQLTLDLASINARGTLLFDFSGTGLTPELDADPAAYEIDTSGGLGADAPVGGAARVFGYVNPFGAAPPDFRAVTTVEYEDLRASLRLVFDTDEAAGAFVSIDAGGVTLNVDAIERGRLRLPGRRTPLGAPDTLPTLLPAEDGRQRFALVERGDTTMFEDFTAFTTALAARLDGTTLARSVTATGDWEPQSALLRARTIVVVLRPVEAG